MDWNWRTHTERLLLSFGASAPSIVEESGAVFAPASTAVLLVNIRSCDKKSMRFFEKRKMKRVCNGFGTLEINSPGKSVAFGTAGFCYRLTEITTPRRLRPHTKVADVNMRKEKQVTGNVVQEHVVAGCELQDSRQ